MPVTNDTPEILTTRLKFRLSRQQLLATHNISTQKTLISEIPAYSWHNQLLASLIFELK